MWLCKRDLSKECEGKYKDCVDCVLDKIKEEILDEAEYAYADFDQYKEDILYAEPDELPDDDFRYGMERAFEIINKYSPQGGYAILPDIAVRGDCLDGIHVEPVPECLIRLNGKKLFHRLFHDGFIKTSLPHILVCVCVAHKDKVDTFTHRGLLQSHYLSVFRII